MEKKCFLHPGDAALPLRRCAATLLLAWRKGTAETIRSFSSCLYAVPFFAVLLFYVMAKKVNYMPCPHFKITITQRSRGQSAVAGAAYQSGEKMFSEYDLKWKFYAEKQGIVYTEIMLPAKAPPEYFDRNTLWNSVEKNEKQWNS